MLWNLRTILGTVLAITSAGVVSADVIRPKNDSTRDSVIVPIPEVSQNRLTRSEPLAPSVALLGPNWASAFHSPLLGPIGSSLAEGSGINPGPVDLALPSLPPDPLRGAGAERMGPKRSNRNPTVTSNASQSNNIRVPEPWSISLILVGVIALAARGRDRLCRIVARV